MGGDQEQRPGALENPEKKGGLDGDKELGVKPLWSLRKLDSS